MLSMYLDIFYWKILPLFSCDKEEKNISTKLTHAGMNIHVNATIIVRFTLSFQAVYVLPKVYTVYSSIVTNPAIHQFEVSQPPAQLSIADKVHYNDRRVLYMDYIYLLLHHDW